MPDPAPRAVIAQPAVPGHTALLETIDARLCWLASSTIHLFGTSNNRLQSRYWLEKPPGYLAIVD